MKIRFLLASWSVIVLWWKYRNAQLVRKKTSMSLVLRVAGIAAGYIAICEALAIGSSLALYGFCPDLCLVVCFYFFLNASELTIASTLCSTTTGGEVR